MKRVTVAVGKAHAGDNQVIALFQFIGRQAAILARLRSVPDVERAHTKSGRFDLLLEVATKTTADLDLVLDKTGEIDGIKSSESLIHLSSKIDRTVAP